MVKQSKFTQVKKFKDINSGHLPPNIVLIWKLMSHYGLFKLNLHVSSIKLQ